MQVFNDSSWETDEVLANNLARIVNIPEHHVLAFLKSRSPADAQKLQGVLRHMPGTNWGKGVYKPPGQCREAEKQAGTDYLAGTRFLTNLGMKTDFQTSYENFFSPSGKFVGKTPDLAFEGVLRNDYKDEFSKWRKDAQEDQVRVLADTCRSLRWVAAQQAGVSSEYLVQFPQHSEDAGEAPSPRKNARNLSRVPLGSIYASPETSTFLNREFELTTKLSDTLARQTNLRQGRFQNQGEKIAMGVCIYRNPGPLVAGTDEPCSGCMDHGVSSNTWKSESRTAWQGDLHSKKQAQRHSNTRTARGFCARECVFQTKDVLAARGERMMPIVPRTQPNPFYNGNQRLENTFNSSRRLFP